MKLNRYRVVFREQDGKRDRHRKRLRDHRGHRGPGYPHFRESDHPKNKKRVQDNVAYSTNQLEHHGVNHIPCRLKDFFNVDFNKNPKRCHADNTHVLGPHFYQCRVRRKALDKRPGKKQPDQKKQDPVEDPEDNAVRCGGIGFFLMLLTEPA